MSNELTHDPGQFDEVIHIIDNARSRAMKAVNAELIQMYWEIGSYVSGRVKDGGWGKSVVADFSEFLQAHYPGTKGFSAQNIWRMKQFYETYCDNEKLSPLVREIPWTSNLLIMTGCKTDEAREFYLRLCIANRYTKRELDRQIGSMLYERTMISHEKHISEGPEGIILEAMLEGYAEFYSAELSEKIHRGQKENALKGKNNGGGVPLGYLLDKKAQKLVIDPVTAPLVVEIFEKYADGKSVRSIVEDFNTRGLKTKKGQPFNINSFSSLLKNRKYIGEYRYQDVVIEGGVPAIVPEDLFNRVQERMEKNRHAPAMAKAKEDYLLTTKLFCGKCERMMVGESGKSHTGAMHYYYKCSGAKRLKDCDKKAVRKDWIECVVVRLTMQRVMDEEKINRLIDAIFVMQEQENITTPALRSQLAETESSIGNILKAIEQGIFTPSTKQRLDELEARKEEILANIQTAELQKPKLTREQMTAWFEQFRHGDPANRDFQKRLIDTFVNAVYVFDDKLVLTYNYQHGTQTISLDEIASALSSDFFIFRKIRHFEGRSSGDF